MTQPVSEPTTARSIGYGQWRTNQLERRPAPASEAGGMSWLAVYDNIYAGQTINTSAGATSLLYPRLDKSDNYADYFAWDAISGAPIGQPYTYLPQILQDGIYTFTCAMASESLGGGNFTIRFRLNLNNGEYAGMQGSDVLLLANQQFAFSTYSLSYPYFVRSWTIPVKVVDPDDPINVWPTVLLSRPSAGADFNITFRNRMWITRLADVDHAGDLNTDDDPGPYGT